jgi:hypothetical protein
VAATARGPAASTLTVAPLGPALFGAMASATPDGFPARPLVFFGLRAGAGAATDSSLARILELRRGCCGAGGGDGVGGGGGGGERIAGGDFFGGDGDFAGEVAIPGDAGWGGGGRIGARRRPSWPVRAGSWRVASAARTHLRGIAGGTTLAAAEGEAGAKLNRLTKAQQIEMIQKQ